MPFTTQHSTLAVLILRNTLVPKDGPSKKVNKVIICFFALFSSRAGADGLRSAAVPGRRHNVICVRVYARNSVKMAAKRE